MKWLLIFALGTTTFAQIKLEGDGAPPPQVVHAKMENISAASGFKNVFDQAVKRSGPHWIGYSVAATPKSRMICCFENLRQAQHVNGRDCLGCKLEKNDGHFMNSGDGHDLSRAPSRAVYVLYRADQGRVMRIRTFTPDCQLDVGGLPLLWLENVPSGESLALLESFAHVTDPSVARKSDDDDDDDDDDPKGKGSFRMADEALEAIALHDDPAADRLLEAFLAPSQPLKLRKQAAFWAGNERGRSGFEMLKRIVPNDQDVRFRREGTFALSQSSEEQEAIQILIAMAHKDVDPDVREQAIFWLAQKASHEAAKAVTDAAENDPESSVRKKAVFALSQMPADQGVPLLIQYAQRHKDPLVRKEAIFWLGQSGDPRALDFLEKLLLSKK